jgi:hypothetical protein
MLNKDEAKINGCYAIAQLFGFDYFRSHIEEACEAYSDGDDVDMMYFLGFEDDGELWTVFAKVNVNRETREVTFLDYKTPGGKRMENPISPIRFTE